MKQRPKEPSTRRSESVRMEARLTLTDFLLVVVFLVPTNERHHFSGSYPFPQLPWSGPYPDKIRRYINGFMGILEQTAAGKRLSQSQLEILREALNEPLGPLAYRTNPARIDEWCKEPSIRNAANFLFAYLNQMEVAGRPSHFACSECGRLCVSRRGGSKFCGPECRQDAWKYSRRPEKLKEYRHEQQRRDLRLKSRAKGDQ